MWYLMLLSIDQDRLAFPAYPYGYVVLFRGYYIVVAQRDGEGNVINCKPQSDRFAEEADAQAAFQSMCPDGI